MGSILPTQARSPQSLANQKSSPRRSLTQSHASNSSSEQLAVAFSAKEATTKSISERRIPSHIIQEQGWCDKFVDRQYDLKSYKYQDETVARSCYMQASDVFSNCICPV